MQIPGNFQNIKQMMSIIKASQNPQAMLNQMINSNPQMKQVMEFINKSGGDPKKAFYTLAQQNGVDPQQILNMLQ